MSTKLHRPWRALWHRFGTAVIIAACASPLALVGVPQLHGHMQHGARLVHSCAIAFRKARKCVKAVENRGTPLVCKVPNIVPPRLLPTPIQIWVPKLFLEACRFEHGPPILS